jgi:prolyl-tRNA synthetase
LPAAAIEQNHDARGIIWPDAIAPFTAVVCPISPDRSPEVKAVAERLYAELLSAGVDAILDDRGERPGRDVCRLGTDRGATPHHDR